MRIPSVSGQQAHLGYARLYNVERFYSSGVDKAEIFQPRGIPLCTEKIIDPKDHTVLGTAIDDAQIRWNCGLRHPWATSKTG